MLGPNLGIDNLEVVLRANARCVALGLDPVSLGGTLAMLFEAAEMGMLASWLCEVLPGAGANVGFGAADLLVELVDCASIAGHPLGQGAARLGAMLGLQHLAMVSKRVELPPFDPRVQPCLGIAYAAAPAGPRYDTIEHDLDFDPVLGLPHVIEEARASGLGEPSAVGTIDIERTARLAELWSGLDALLICTYASTPTRPLHLARIVELVAAATGRTIGEETVFALGREYLAAQHRINATLSVSAEDDTLPDRFFDEAIASGRFSGRRLDRAQFEGAISELRQRWQTLDPS